ncbi:Putative CCR4-associated factor 1 homolog 3 [Zea mays]|jgi:CCR4-NOT transcription complex subunit 7/8|uniref:poly(A)-specific ribonuclease n=2 Tax=Zea mays TaxID=4577 RepID=A0A1D6F9L9_MAIZE|nr:Putative CCR4-associated factor 1 homolog 3 [Zea mays]
MSGSSSLWETGAPSLDTLAESAATYAVMMSSQQQQQQQTAGPSRQAVYGAPVLPEIPTRFVYRPQVATDVMSGSSSLWKTGAPPHDTLAESAAMYAATLSSHQQQQQMARPDRQAMYGAPVLPEIPTRFVYRPQTATDVMSSFSSLWETGAPPPAAYAAMLSSQQQQMPTTRPGWQAAPRGAPVPPPMNMRFVPNTMPAADAMDVGSSAPMAPSDSSSERTPSPLQRVEVRQVWAHNFDSEAKLIESLLPKFRYVAVDTEFPGTVYRPAGPAYKLEPAERYRLLRCNVDALHPVQLGLTLFDAGCVLPGGHGGATRYVWQFNFSDFDVRRHRHVVESVAALRSRGVDLDRTRQYGVAAAAVFGPRLRKWTRAGLGRAGVVTSHGGYDLAYLVKMMFGTGFRMSGSAAEFNAVVKSVLHRRRVFDIGEMARLCPHEHLHRGLDSIAGQLNAARFAADAARQAGYDSLRTCYTFMKLREIYFDDDGKLAGVDGILAEVTAF